MSISSFAHHSRAPYYDLQNTVTVTGTVTGIDWVNPHSFIYLDVKTGTVEKWTVELYPTTLMSQLGVERDTIKVGDTLTVLGMAPKSGGPPHVTFGLDLTLADGRRVRSPEAPNRD
jgi:hypothetical protein